MEQKKKAKPNIPIPKIPIFNTPDVPLTGTTQDHLPIADIVDDVVLFKDGGAAIVLESTSLNFGLLSDREQEAVVAAYAALINSLSFSIEVVIRTQKKDVTQYINYIDEAAAKIESPKLKELMAGYRNFVIETTKKRNVLGKRFFIVVPFSPLELGITQSFKIVAKRSGGLPYTKDYVLKKSKISLLPKRDHLVRQAARLGLRLRQLTTEEIVDLYYDVYNPRSELVKSKKPDEVSEEPKETNNEGGVNQNEAVPTK